MYGAGYYLVIIKVLTLLEPCSVDLYLLIREKLYRTQDVVLTLGVIFLV